MIRLILTFAVLSSLAAELPGAPPVSDAQLHQAARQFRIDVYQTFHASRAECEGRWEMGRRAVSAWRAAGSDDAHRAELLGWFQQAAVASRMGSVAPLPAVPQFDGPANGTRRPADGPSLGRRPPSVATAPPFALVPSGALRRMTTPETPPAQRPPAELHVPRAALAPLPTVAQPFETAPTAMTARSTFKPIIAEAATIAVDAPQASPATDAGINTRDLRARVAGHNLRLRAVRVDLQRDGLWDVDRLARQAAELTDLAATRELVGPYLAMLGDDERRGVGTLESAAPVVAALGKRVFEVRQKMTPAAYGGPESHRRADLDRLEQISKQLATLAGRS